MASEIKVTPENEEMLEKEGPESPPLDLSDAAVMDLLHSAKKRGYVTNDQIDALLSSAEVKSEQIEDILAKFSEMGVHVVETDPELEVEVATHEEPEEEAEGGNELVEVQQRPVSVKSKAKDPAERTDDPVRMYLRDMSSVDTAFACGRGCNCQTHRGRPRGHARGALREPAHFPGYHHLAGRARGGQNLPSRHHRPRRDPRRL